MKIKDYCKKYESLSLIMHLMYMDCEKIGQHKIDFF